MLYGKYADGSIWAPREDRPRLFENRDEVLEEYIRNIFKAYGKEYVPSKCDDPKNDRPLPVVSTDTGPTADVRLHPEPVVGKDSRSGLSAAGNSGKLSRKE